VVQGVGPEFKPQYWKKKKVNVGKWDNSIQNLVECEMDFIPSLSCLFLLLSSPQPYLTRNLAKRKQLNSEKLRDKVK
jgi:hypothetical protein